MRHIPALLPREGAGNPLKAYAEKLYASGKPLPHVAVPGTEKTPRLPRRTFQAPHLLCVTARPTAPIPGQSPDLPDDEEEKAPGDVENVGTGAGKSTQKGASRKSLLNLARFLSSLDWKKHGTCLHITHTYWKTWPTKDLSPLLRKRALMDEKDDIARWYRKQGFCGIWRLEFQSRADLVYLLAWMLCVKAGYIWPLDALITWVEHWHCLVWIGHADEDDVEKKVRRWWHLHSGNGHERAICVTSGDAARGTWYLAMHASKSDQTPKFEVGRWWGYLDPDRIKEAQDVHCTDDTLRWAELVWLCRLYRRATGNNPRGFISPHTTERYQYPGGFSWFLPRGKQNELILWVREKVKEENQAGKRRAFFG